MGCIPFQAACSSFIHLRNCKINEVNATQLPIPLSPHAPLQDTYSSLELTEWDTLEIGKEAFPSKHSDYSSITSWVTSFYHLGPVPLCLFLPNTASSPCLTAVIILAFVVWVLPQAKSCLDMLVTSPHQGPFPPSSHSCTCSPCFLAGNDLQCSSHGKVPPFVLHHFLFIKILTYQQAN